MINLFARAADAPQMAFRLDTDVTEPATGAVRGLLGLLPPAKRVTQGGARRARAAGLGAHLRRLPDPLRLAARRRRRWRARGSRCRRWRATRRGSGTTGSATSIRTSSSDRSLAGAVRGKIVLITGASSGIGRATAVKVADAGATVLLVARSIDKLEETKAEILAAGGAAHIHRATSPTSRTSSGWRRRCSPTTATSTSSSTTPVARSGARWRSPTTASTITSGRSSSTTSAPCG